MSVAVAASLRLSTGHNLPNRLVKSAMSETQGTADNRVTEQIIQLSRRWAQGGFGMQITGNVMVDPKALGEPGNVVVAGGEDMPMLRRWAEAMSSEGGLAYMQLNHPGRQVPRFLNATSVAPSAVPFSPAHASMFATARQLTHEQILKIIDSFAHSAHIAEQAGFHGVQIHGAHGYLITQFLSPATNLRTDRWGGTAEKRRAFLHCVFAAIREATSPEFGIALKINTTDFHRDGVASDSTVDTLKAIAADEYSFIELSGGTYESPAMLGDSRTNARVDEHHDVSAEGYFLDIAHQFRAHTRIPLLVTGGFRSAAAMNAAVESGIDMVGVARGACTDPDLAKNVLTHPQYRTRLALEGSNIPVLKHFRFLEMPWYEGQLHRMGAGLEPSGYDKFLPPLWRMLSTQGRKAFATRRAR